MVALLLLALVRGCFFAIEQPTNSFMIHFPYIKFLKLAAEKVYYWFEVNLHLGPTNCWVNGFGFS